MRAETVWSREDRIFCDPSMNEGVTQRRVAPNQELRYPFGKNWDRFLSLVNEERITQAEASLRAMFGVNEMRGKSFLDIGSGSGLFSVAARRLGARVHSFDYDPRSVACTKELKRRYFPDDPEWIVESGSALDANYVRGLGEFDFVYSWGVLHHTGDMWRGLANAVLPVNDRGRLFIAIYNDQGWLSQYWTWVKRVYNTSAVLRLFVILVHIPYLLVVRFLVRALTGRLSIERGMSMWYDMFDWLGGYPFEVAAPTEISEFYNARGFRLIASKTCGRRMGCNEFVFEKTDAERAP